MKKPYQILALVASLSLASVALAQAPPAGSTGICKDGTYTQAASKSGACRGHQGIKEWYAAAPATPAAPKTPAAPASASKSATPAPPTASAPAPKPAPAPVAAPAPAPKPAPAPAPAAAPAASGRMSPQQRAATMTQAAGGGPGLVWFNADSKVYHCPGSTFYGKTKQGQYMSEVDAKAKGGHPDHNHPCTK
jgi:outer membrane biosynthesis protein TonB